MKLHTIGFTKKGAEKFFKLLKNNNIQTIIDVRLNNTSQLSGFAKKDDLKFFLEEICGCSYIHLPDLAPTKEILKPYQKNDISWDSYKNKFEDLMQKRNVEKYLNQINLNQNCLLCSEHLPHFCHRRLIVEYLQKFENDIQCNHLV